MADEFSVDTEALRTDASTWRGWQDRLNDIGSAVPTVGSDLDFLAFSLLPGADQVRTAYASIASGLADQIATGATVFDGVASTLTAVCDLYEDAEAAIVESFRTR